MPRQFSPQDKRFERVVAVSQVVTGLVVAGLFDVDEVSRVHQVLNGPSPSLVGHIRRPLGPSRACSRLRSRRRRRDQHPVTEWHPVTDQPQEQREQLRPEGPAGK